MCCKFLVTGQPSPQLYTARPGLALSLLALAQSWLQALPTAALSQGPALQADPRTHPRTNLAGNSPVQGSPQCRDLPGAEISPVPEDQPCLAHISTVESVQQGCKHSSCSLPLLPLSSHGGASILWHICRIWEVKELLP